jgi:uncharacterized protein (TIGR03437 family)
MSKYQVPGGAVAIIRNGKLVFAHGYGMADVETGSLVQPDSIFRIASVSKSITAVAILKLIQERKFTIDTKAADLLPALFRDPGLTTGDSRLERITVRMLLEHSGGWDSTITRDVNTRQVEAATALAAPSPASSTTMIRFMLRLPLDFDPGTRFAYSNLGYLILGRIVEAVTGVTYEQYIRDNIAAPLGIYRMRIGQSLRIGAAPGEVTYYSSRGYGDTTSVFPYGPRIVPWQYGGEYREAYDSNGGWTASAVDLVKLWSAIDGRYGNAILTPSTMNLLTSRSSLRTFAGANTWYGLGFTVEPVGVDYNLSHGGGLVGTRSLAVRYASTAFSTGSFNYVGLFNVWPDHADHPNYPFLQELSSAMGSLFRRITAWPALDHFPSFETTVPVHPFINGQDGVLQSASFERGIVPGSWFSILGTQLSSSTRLWKDSDFADKAGSLPFELDGVIVHVGGRPAAVYYVSPGQINAQVPDGLSEGATWVAVTRDGHRSAPVVAEICNSSPALFTYSIGAEAHAAGIHPDGKVVGDPLRTPGATPARSGETIILYASGLSPSPAGSMILSPRPFTASISVMFGSTPATVRYAGNVSPGLFQLNVTVPDVTGEQALTVRTAGRESRAVRIAVH